MKKFLDDYFNISKIVKSKREYKKQMERVNALPEDYQYVFKKIQEHMWQFASGAGYDMMEVHCDLIELFEEGALNGKAVLQITGEDVAAFVDELLKNTKTYTNDWRIKLNNEVKNKLEGKNVEPK